MVAHGRQAVIEDRRHRLFGAMVASVGERGYTETRVADLVELSGVSLRSFYDLFPDKQACFLATVEAMVKATIRPVLESAGPEEWELDSKRRLGIAASLATAQPAAARVCLLEAYVAGPEVAPVVDEATVRMEGLVAERLAGSSRWADLPPEIGTFAIGAILETFRARLIDDRATQLPALADQLATLLLRYEAPLRPLRSAARPPEVRPEQLEASDHAERALRAFEALLTEQALAATTMDQVAKAAGMSLKTLYANFTSRDELMIAAIDSAGAQLVATALPAFRRQRNSSEGVRLALSALLGALASRPNLANLLLFSAYEGGAPALRRRAEALRPLETLLTRSAPSGLLIPRTVVAEAVLRGLLWLARRRMSEAGPGALPGLAPICTFLALAPLLGPEQATAAAEGKSYRRQPQAGPASLDVVPKAGIPIILTVLSQEPISVDSLVEKTLLPREEVEAELAKLEEEEQIERVADEGGVVFRSRWPTWRTQEWERIEQGDREAASAEITLAMKEEVEDAIAAGTFDAHPERALVRVPIWVDEQGWKELHDLLEVTFDECLAIQQRIGQRLKEKDQHQEGFPARVHLASFEPAPSRDIDR